MSDFSIHLTLEELFDDIANAIRNKTDSTEEITADDFPDAIVSIPSEGADIESYPDFKEGYF